MTALEIINEAAGRNVGLAERLDELPLDSLELVELLWRIEQETGVAVTARELMSLATVKDLHDFVAHVVRSEAFLAAARKREAENADLRG